MPMTGVISGVVTSKDKTKNDSENWIFLWKIHEYAIKDSNLEAAIYWFSRNWYLF